MGTVVLKMVRQYPSNSNSTLSAEEKNIIALPLTMNNSVVKSSCQKADAIWNDLGELSVHTRTEPKIQSVTEKEQTGSTQNSKLRMLVLSQTRNTGCGMPMQVSIFRGKITSDWAFHPLLWEAIWVCMGGLLQENGNHVHMLHLVRLIVFKAIRTNSAAPSLPGLAIFTQAIHLIHSGFLSFPKLGF